jgi:hypothetical protein
MQAAQMQLEPMAHVLETDIAKTKSEFEHIAETIRTRYSEEDQVIQRVEQVQAAIQRLEWALERALELPGGLLDQVE